MSAIRLIRCPFFCQTIVPNENKKVFFFSNWISSSRLAKVAAFAASRYSNTRGGASLLNRSTSAFYVPSTGRPSGSSVPGGTKIGKSQSTRHPGLLTFFLLPIDPPLTFCCCRFFLKLQINSRWTIPFARRRRAIVRIDKSLPYYVV